MDQPVLAGVLFGLILAWAFLLSIAALVVLELIVPTGSIASPRRVVAGCGCAGGEPGDIYKCWQ